MEADPIIYYNFQFLQCAAFNLVNGYYILLERNLLSHIVSFWAWKKQQPSERCRLSIRSRRDTHHKNVRGKPYWIGSSVSENRLAEFSEFIHHEHEHWKICIQLHYDTPIYIMTLIFGVEKNSYLLSYGVNENNCCFRGTEWVTYQNKFCRTKNYNI